MEDLDLDWSHTQGQALVFITSPSSLLGQVKGKLYLGPNVGLVISFQKVSPGWGLWWAMWPRQFVVGGWFCLLKCC